MLLPSAVGEEELQLPAGGFKRYQKPPELHITREHKTQQYMTN